MNIILAVFLGGGLGSVARYLVGRAVMILMPTSFPFGTLIANVASCIVLGSAVYLFGKQPVQSYWVPFIIIGFCGGFSTFSTFSYETLLLAQQGKWLWTVLNIVVSIVSCLLILIAFTRQVE